MLKPERNSEERPGLVEGPTRYKTFVNSYPARCGMCGGQFFVNESVHAAIITAAQEGSTTRSSAATVRRSTTSWPTRAKVLVTGAGGRALCAI
jgi:hypothetical protein